MLLSTEWLKEDYGIDLPPELLAERLTMAGLEVDNVAHAAPPFSGVVVAQVLTLLPSMRVVVRLCKSFVVRPMWPSALKFRWQRLGQYYLVTFTSSNQNCVVLNRSACSVRRVNWG